MTRAFQGKEIVKAKAPRQECLLSEQEPVRWSKVNEGGRERSYEEMRAEKDRKKLEQCLPVVERGWDSVHKWNKSLCLGAQKVHLWQLMGDEYLGTDTSSVYEF